MKDDLQKLIAPVVCCVESHGEMNKVEDEVDIGIGSQSFILYYECQSCGKQIGLCYDCGAPEDDRGHWGWCDKLIT